MKNKENNQIIEVESFDELKEIPKENNSIITKLIITKIILMNFGNVYINRPVLDANVSYKQLKLPKECKLYIFSKDSYHDVVIGDIIRNGRTIATLYTKLRSYYDSKEASKIIEELMILNDNHVNFENTKNGYKIVCDLPIEEIIFPENLGYEINYYPAEGKNDIQCKIISNDNKVFPGTLICYLKNEKELKRQKKCN